MSRRSDLAWQRSFAACAFLFAMFASAGMPFPLAWTVRVGGMRRRLDAGSRVISTVTARVGA